MVIDSTDIDGSRIQLHTLEANTEYTWRIKALNTSSEGPWSTMYRFTTDGDTTPTDRASDEPIPNAPQLYQNYPNPFNPETTIAFEVPATTYVTVKVYDLMGKTIATLLSETMPAGRHEVRWEASGFPSGLYLYQLQTETYTSTRTLTFLK